MIATQANLTHSQIPVQLTISTDALVLKRISDSQILCSHRMEGISFASAGEHVRDLFLNYFVGFFLIILGYKRLYSLCCER
jgi:hypothetical protein